MAVFPSVSPEDFHHACKNQEIIEFLCTMADKVYTLTATSVAHDADLLTIVYMLQVLQSLHLI